MSSDASSRTVPLELWPSSCDERTPDGYRCTLACGHTGAHFDSAASRHFVLTSDRARIEREQLRRGH